MSPSIPTAAALRNRPPHHAPCRLCPQQARAQAHRGGIWMDQDRGRSAQEPPSRHRTGRLDVHPHGGRLQLGAHPQAAGAGMNDARSPAGDRDLPTKASKIAKSCRLQPTKPSPRSTNTAIHRYFHSLVGHRITGDRTGQSSNRGVGWEHLHVAVDDASRLAYTELLPDERKHSAVAFSPVPWPGLPATASPSNASSATTARHAKASCSPRPSKLLGSDS